MFEQNAKKPTKKVKRNLLLPVDFLNRWISTKKDGTKCFKYIDFSSDEVIEIDIDNDPFINLLFGWDSSFDLDIIQKQYNQIAKVAKAIIEKRIEKKEKLIDMTGKEVLFIKYFYFLVSLLNGNYKYLFNSYGKTYRIFDVLNKDCPVEVRKGILSIVSYVLFEMYDSIFTSRTFEQLYEYVKESDINFTNQEYKKQIIVSSKDLKSQNFKFLDVYFHNVVNNTFLKIYKVSDLDRSSFVLTNKTIANFIEEKTKINVLSVFVIDPRFAIGLVNLGPGRAEYRPLFKYLTNNNEVDTANIPICLRPEHEIEEDGIFLKDDQRFIFKSFELTSEQIKLINDCLTFRDLKIDLDLFTKY